METVRILVLVAYCSIVLAKNQNNTKLPEIGLKQILIIESSDQSIKLDVSTNSPKDIVINPMGPVNLTISQIGLTQLLANETLKKHVDLEAVTDSPIDIVNKSDGQINVTIIGSNYILFEKHVSPDQQAELTKVLNSTEESRYPFQTNESDKFTTSKQASLLDQTTIVQHQLLGQTQSNKLNEDTSQEFLSQLTTPLPILANLNEIPHTNQTNKQNYPLINTITYVITVSTYNNIGNPSFPPMSSPSGLLAKLLSGNIPRLPTKPVNQGNDIGK